MWEQDKYGNFFLTIGFLVFWIIRPIPVDGRIVGRREAGDWLWRIMAGDHIVAHGGGRTFPACAKDMGDAAQGMLTTALHDLKFERERVVHADQR